MARYYPSSTLVTGIRYELVDVLGTAATLGSGNEGGSAFVEKLRFEKVVDNTVSGTSFPCSVDMATVSASTLEWRFRVVKVDSTGAITAGSAYSAVHNTAGIKTETLTLSTTWTTGDRLGLSFELRKTGGGGNRSFSLNVNDTDSYIDAPVTVPVSGSAAQTLPALTQSASGSVEVSGTGSQTLPALTQSGDATVEVTGMAVQTLSALTQSGSGSVSEAGVSGSAAQTLPVLTQGASGAVEVEGTCTQALPSLTQQGQGSLEVEGTASQTLPLLGQSVSGSATVEGSGAQTLPALTQSAQGTVGDVVAGSIAQNLPALTQGASGSISIAGDGASILAALSQAATGEVSVGGTGSQALPTLLSALVGTVSGGNQGVAVVGPTGARIVNPSNQARITSHLNKVVVNQAVQVASGDSENSVEV